MTDRESEPYTNDDRAPEYRRDESWAETQLAIAEGQRRAYEADCQANEVRTEKHSHECRSHPGHYLCQVAECDIADDRDDERRQCAKCWAERRDYDRQTEGHLVRTP